MEIALLFGVFAVLLVLGVPIAFALSVATLATIAYLGLPPIVVVEKSLPENLSNLSESVRYSNGSVFIRNIPLE